MPERFRFPSFEKLVNLYRVLAVITILSVIFFASAKLIKNPIVKGDLQVYLHAARLLLAGNNPYLIPVPLSNYFYLYPPLLAFLFIPLLSIPINTVVVLWCLLNVLLIGWVMKAFYELISGTPFFHIPRKTLWVVCFFALLPSFRFIFSNLSYGQSNIVMLALAVLGLVYWQKRKEVAGGAAIGFSIAIKLFTLPLAVWFAARRNLRVTLGIAAGVLIGLLLPALLLGFHKNLEFLDYWVKNVVLYNDLTNAKWGGLHINNLSLEAQLYRFFTDTVSFEYGGRAYYLTLFTLPAGMIHIISRLIVVAVAGAVLLYALIYRNRIALVAHWGGIALTFSLVPLFATVMQKHYLVLLLPAYIYVVHLWYSVHLKDKVFRGLVVASMAVLTFISAAFCGEFLSRVFAASGCHALGVLLLSAAIFRAAACLPAQE